MESKMYYEIHEQKPVLKGVYEHYKDGIFTLSELLKNTKRVFLAGTGASYNACMAAHTAFIRYGGIIPHIFHAEALLRFPSWYFKNAIVLLVSQSGESYETKALCKYVHTSGGKLWGITNNPCSALAESSDNLLLLEAGEEVSSATKTWSASLLVLYMLALRGTKDFRMLSFLPEIVGNAIIKAEESIDPVAALIGDEPGYIAGIGPVTAAARQGALMLKEKCFLHFEGLSINELRHGAIETISENTPVFISFSGSREVKNVAGHIEYLNSITNKCFVIAGGVDHMELTVGGHRVVHLPAASEACLSHISHVSFYQLLSEKIASARGYDVDGFRYISKVIENY